MVLAHGNDGLYGQYLCLKQKVTPHGFEPQFLRSERNGLPLADGVLKNQIFKEYY